MQLQDDASLFTRSDEVERAWELCDPLLSDWEGRGGPPLAFYDPDSWRPAEADALLMREGNAWTLGCAHYS